jgi:hypothetical protein
MRAGMSHPSVKPNLEGVYDMPVFVLGVVSLALAVGSIHWSLGVATLMLVGAGYYIHTRRDFVSWLKGYILWGKYTSFQTLEDYYPTRKTR